MDRKIYVFGTDHNYPREDPSLSKDQIDQFETEIENSCNDLNICLLAEENNLEAQKQNDLKHSLLHHVSKMLGIVHIYCDPNRKQRAKLGIQQENDIRVSYIFKNIDEQNILNKIRDSHRKRELVWLKAINNVNKWPVLLVCGADHVNSFSSLAKEEGCVPEIFRKDWHS